MQFARHISLKHLGKTRREEQQRGEEWISRRQLKAEEGSDDTQRRHASSHQHQTTLHQLEPIPMSYTLYILGFIWFFLAMYIDMTGWIASFLPFLSIFFIVRKPGVWVRHRHSSGAWIQIQWEISRADYLRLFFVLCSVIIDVLLVQRYECSDWLTGQQVFPSFPNFKKFHLSPLLWIFF